MSVCAGGARRSGRTTTPICGTRCVNYGLSGENGMAKIGYKTVPKKPAMSKMGAMPKIPKMKPMMKKMKAGKLGR